MSKSIFTRIRNSFGSHDPAAKTTGASAMTEPPVASATPTETRTAPVKPLVPVEARQTKNQREGKTFFKWSRRRSPTSQTMMLDSLRIVYQPIAKNACSSTKRLIAGLGGFVPEQGQGIHHALDSQNTGLQFKDRTPEDVDRALNEDGWMRFVIYRDPLERLVSAYVEKFVQNRTHPNQRKTIDGVIKAVFETDQPTEEDYEHGITFREFAEYILAENPNHLNSHWQPQTHYMGHITFTHMYDVKRLDRLENDLREHIGEDIELPKMNVSRDRSAELEYLPMAADLLPRDLVDSKRLSIQSFLHEDLRPRLSEYYAADMSIYRMVQIINGAISRRD